ncbi:hypothetical protein LC605_15025 [Nostoc sp. CHAB 5836]|uniref:hypothetical protein n=1 Tax=Nostoc sp. CHAB 5836 TaxID=2780404 RepID=UPI001E2C68A2|nr:hypothetical protein [Nostoc sp. CHAB 5836]MCC5616358.1 hypothetical protein [Nostoc sp. CHAB 5836]
MIIEEWIAQYPILLRMCEAIRGKTIKRETWITWEKLAGACYQQGKKRSLRSYTQEQTELLLCLAYMRKLFPTREITYRSLRDYWGANKYKVEEALEAACNPPVVEKPPEVKLIPLPQVKKCCDEVMGRKLTKQGWLNWKQHLVIPKNSKLVDEGIASLLVFMSCWRHDNPTAKFPSVNRLIVMMGKSARTAMSLETASSSKMLHQWEMQGCFGEDLPKYLAASGCKLSISTLYKRGEFSLKRHYSVSELADWRRTANTARHRRSA